jgi:hypothetical protein
LKINFTYFLITFFLAFCFQNNSAQNLEMPLAKANSQIFNGNIHAAGLSVRDKKTVLVVYKINFKLIKTDSLIIDLGKHSPDNFLQITSDTLHGFLNIYVHKKDKKTVNIFRINKYFKQLTAVEDIDIARINSISAFENEIFYSKSDVYTIKYVNDTSGKQFYLNKYTLKSELSNFEYEPKWQFAFERKNINSAHIIYADNKYLLMYVNVITGPKKGQWILKMNTVTGLLWKGSKINDQGDNGFYSFNQLLIDTAGKKTLIQGQRFTEAEFDQEQNKIKLCNRPILNIYIAEIDTAGEIISRNEFKIPVVEAKGVVYKVPVNYLIKTNSMVKNTEGALVIETDIFKGLNNRLSFNYCNSNTIKLSPNEDKFVPEKNSISTNPLIEKYYFNNDALDMTGRLAIDSIMDFEKLFYRQPTFTVKAGYKLDDAGNPVWLVKKIDNKTNMQNFSILGPVKKIYQLTNILDINRSENPAIIYLAKNQFMISRQSFADRFQLQLYNW